MDNNGSSSFGDQSSPGKDQSSGDGNQRGRGATSQDSGSSKDTSPHAGVDLVVYTSSDAQIFTPSARFFCEFFMTINKVESTPPLAGMCSMQMLALQLLILKAKTISEDSIRRTL